MRTAALGGTSLVAAGSTSLAALPWQAPRWPRARPAVACDYEYDGHDDEYAEAYERYKTLGLFDKRLLADEEEEDDDTTSYEMLQMSRQQMARLRRRDDGADAPAAAAEIDKAEAARRAEWEQRFVDELRAEHEPGFEGGGGSEGVGGSTG